MILRGSWRLQKAPGAQPLIFFDLRFLLQTVSTRSQDVECSKIHEIWIIPQQSFFWFTVSDANCVHIVSGRGLQHNPWNLDHPAGLLSFLFFWESHRSVLACSSNQNIQVCGVSPVSGMWFIVITSWIPGCVMSLVSVFAPWVSSVEFALALRIAHFAVRIAMRKLCFAPCLFSVSPSSQSEYSCVVPNCVQCFIREFV